MNVFLYPGQGAQSVGMGKDLYDAFPIVKQTFQLASEISRQDLAQLIFHGDEETLKQTKNTQIAITLINVTTALVLKEKGLESSICAGFSLGEYAALWDAGVLSLEDLFRIVLNRGQYMQETGEQIEARSGGTPPGMCAVMGLSSDAIEEVLKNLGQKNVFIANYNSPVQTIIAGEDDALKLAIEALKEAKAKRCIPLKVSGPFHTPLLVDAAEKLKDSLKRITFLKPQKSVYSNVIGGLITDDMNIQELSYQQVINPVRWTSIEEHILKQNPNAVYEVGPGKVLTGLWKAMTDTLVCKPTNSLEEIKNII